MIGGGGGGDSNYIWRREDRSPDLRGAAERRGVEGEQCAGLPAPLARCDYVCLVCLSIESVHFLSYIIALIFTLNNCHITETCGIGLVFTYFTTLLREYFDPYL